MFMDTNMMYIFIKTQFEKLHKWENAPKSEAFLRNLHRHIFHVKVTISVEDDDREIEYFALKKKVDQIIKNHITGTTDTHKETMSCEQIAEIILDVLELEYDNNEIQVEISEDNENGSIVNNFERFAGVQND